MIENTYEDEKEDETTVLDDEVLKDQCGAVLYSLERWYEEMGFYQRIQTKLDEIRDKLVISDLFVARLLKSSIQVDGCYRNSLAMATCCFHTPDD
ncbi:hypothetical protein V1477_021220 [Vespula maculifrons]|uniref:Uncharacterized protein n=1 Tax=Vespula maculifrons TaxID=7453 RepID=A0ABD2AGH5_VESMC